MIDQAVGARHRQGVKSPHETAQQFALQQFHREEIDVAVPVEVEDSGRYSDVSAFARIAARDARCRAILNNHGDFQGT